MQCEKISMEEVESHITQALYQVVSEQTRASDTNIRIRQRVGEEEEKKIEALKNDSTPNWLSSANSYIGYIAPIVAGVMMGLCIFSMAIGASYLIPLFGLVGGIAMIAQGGFSTAEGVFQGRAANDNGLIKQKTALEGYVETRNDNINTKTKNAYKALSSLTRAFNKLIATFGDTVMKVIK